MLGSISVYETIKTQLCELEIKKNFTSVYNCYPLKRNFSNPDELTQSSSSIMNIISFFNQFQRNNKLFTCPN